MLKKKICHNCNKVYNRNEIKKKKYVLCNIIYRSYFCKECIEKKLNEFERKIN